MRGKTTATYDVEVRFSTRDKILDRAAAREARDRLRADARRVVFTNGCFDLLHPGHLDYLERARELGDALFVALNDDASVRRLKGESRPIVPLNERMEVIAALRAVDVVTSFSEDTPREIIAALVPDVLVKGADWAPDQVVGRDTVEAAGGRVVLIPFFEGHSTSRIVAAAQAGRDAHGS